MTNPTTNYMLGKIQHAEYEARFGSRQSERDGVARTTMVHALAAFVQRAKAKIPSERPEQFVTCQGDA